MIVDAIHGAQLDAFYNFMNRDEQKASARRLRQNVSPEPPKPRKYEDPQQLLDMDWSSAIASGQSERQSPGKKAKAKPGKNILTSQQAAHQALRQLLKSPSLQPMVPSRKKLLQPFCRRMQLSLSSMGAIGTMLLKPAG